MSLGDPQVSGLSASAVPPGADACAEEPIHLPGAIQPFAAVLAVDAAFDIAAASANLGEFLGVSASSTLGRPLREVVGDALTEEIRGRGGVLASDAFPCPVSGAAMPLDVELAPAGPLLLIQLEPVTPGLLTSAARMDRALLGRLGNQPDVESICQVLVDTIQGLTGFDRVMAFRFDGEWNGEVMSEQRRPDLESWLHLHYPAEDISAQARALYRRQHLGVMPSVSYQPVAIYGHTIEAQSIDLSGITARSMSPVHREYLNNLGATATMSISLMVGGELWGMINAQHYSGELSLPASVRDASHCVADLASHLVASQLITSAAHADSSARAALADLSARLGADDRPGVLDALAADPDLLAVADADGAFVFCDGETRRVGLLPHDDVCLEAIARLQQRRSFAASSDDLPRLLEGFATEHDVAGGMLLASDLQDRGVAYYRAEEVRHIDWAGRPTHSALPRTDFSPWRETIRGQSRAWEPWRTDLIERLGAYIGVLHRRQDRLRMQVADVLRRDLVDVNPLSGLLSDRIGIGTRYLPAARSPLGGDWWDVFPLDPDRVVAVIGDVAGHGVDAVAAMVQLRASLRAYLLDGHTAGKALDSLDVLVDRTLGDRIATAAVAIIDQRHGDVDFASAGHLAPLVCGAGRCHEVTTPQRPLLGLGEGRCEQIRFTLSAGETLLLYTDGLVERRDADIDFGRDRLVRSAKHASGELEEWLDQVLTLQGVDPTSSNDDTTILALRLR